VRFAAFLTAAVAALIAGAVLATPEPAQDLLPTYTATQIDGPVVMADPVHLALDTLRLVGNATAQYCATRNATGYMRDACSRLTRALARLAAIDSSRFRVRAETLTTVIHDTIPAPAPPPPNCQPPSCNPGSPGNVGFAIHYATNSDAQWFPNPGVDTVTLCAVLEDMAGTRRLAWPPVRFKTLAAGDSLVSWGTRGGNPLSQMCAKAIQAVGVTQTDSVPVTWAAVWFDYRSQRLWRPLPSLPHP